MTNLQKNLTKSERPWKMLGGYSEMRILKHTCAVFWDRLVFLHGLSFISIKHFVW